MKRICALCLILLLFLSGCGGQETAHRIQVTATVYPIAVAARAVCQDVPGVSVDQLVADTGGCVHDYSLSVRDLQKLERTDLLVLSGAGLEDFLDGLFDRYDQMAVCDTSVSLEGRLLAGGDHEHHEHDHDAEADVHVWMDPGNLALQTQAIAREMARLDPDYAGQYRENAAWFCDQLEAADRQLQELLSPLACREIVTFHEGFGYFGRRYGFSVTGIEEEAGGEASARVLMRLSEKIRTEQIPAVFYEENGSSRSAEVLSRDCGVNACPLSMLMDGDGTPEGLLQAMIQNGKTIAEEYQP